jgi:hypothetical protein
MARLLTLTVALFAVSASLASALPPGSPPKMGGGPPPAWLELPGTDRWLAYSSFCWKTLCADFLPPQMRTDLPRVKVAPGKLVRFHLGFRPSSLSLQRIGAQRTWKLAAARVSSWKVAARGVYVLDAGGPGGSAGYAFRIV